MFKNGALHEINEMKMLPTCNIKRYSYYSVLIISILSWLTASFIYASYFIPNVSLLTASTYNDKMTIGSNEWIGYKASRNTGWLGYRLGDMIYEWLEPSDLEHHKKNFPNSIAVEYYNKLGPKYKVYTGNADISKDNLNILLQTIQWRNQSYPGNDTLVVHLRLGDVIDDKTYFEKYFLRCKIFHAPLSVFEELKPKLISYNISQIVMVTGFHLTNYQNHTNSIKYILTLKRWMVNNSFSVSFRINENADQDFMFMANSKYFLQNIGGYSRLISQIVKFRNGIVFNANECWSHDLNKSTSNAEKEKLRSILYNN